MKIEPYWICTEIDDVPYRFAAIARTIYPDKKITDYVINSIEAAKLESYLWNEGPYEIIIDDYRYWKYENMLGDKLSLEIE